MAANRRDTPPDGFGPVLRRFRVREGKSRNRIAHEVGCDPSYWTRLEEGDRSPPRLHIVEAMARALRLSLADRNRLLVAAGYTPLTVAQLGSWDDALQAVADVLTDPNLSAEERAEFRIVVQAIAGHWRGVRLIFDTPTPGGLAG